LAALAGTREPDDPDLIEAYRDLTAARLEYYALEAVYDHPITNAQRSKIIDILAGSRDVVA
jgi:hypothetical protein